MWTTICSDMARVDSQLLMENMKVFIVVKSQLVPCVVCALTKTHKMRYQLLKCSSETCKEAAPYEECLWKGKVLTAKDYDREMATQVLKPARIRNGMARRFGLTEKETPTLRQMQWFVSSYSKTNLHRNGYHDEILRQIEQLMYCPSVLDMKPFLFGWKRDAHSRPDVGNGSDENPFLVGLTTKRLLLNAARDPDSFVFHMDATFKLNQVGYPVIVCGISDKCGSFDLDFASVSGGRHLVITFVMADAEAAQQNAVVRVIGADSDFVYLMCFYHVMTKVHERLKSVPDRLSEQVMADIYDLHFATTSAVYDEQVKQVLTKWSGDEHLVGFQDYFERTWVPSAFWRWQCFHTASGFATTNNPVEQFNRLTKRDYTLRTKHKIGPLVQLLADCCQHQSVIPKPIKEARVKDFRRRDLLLDRTPGRSSIEFLLVSPNPNEMGTNYARMETEGQPDGGWCVDGASMTCECKYYFNFAICIFLLFALQVKRYTGLDRKRTLVNRTVVRKRRRTQQASSNGLSSRVPAGRPQTNGHALSL
ncbi:hypothetical protein F443_01952, partial [Phytophthora nicotianae P1569]